MSGHIAFVGVGRMGEALVAGLLRGGREPRDLIAVVRRGERVTELRERHGLESGTSVADAVRGASMIVLTVKPQDVDPVLAELGPVVTPDQVVVSVAAGVRTSYVEASLEPGVPVVRVMSNVAVLVDEAMSVVAPGAHAQEPHLAAAEELFRAVGRVLRLPERHLDAVTATSGSGPAYFFLLAEAMIEACILLGLPRDVATELMIQTMVGAAKMLRETGRHPVELREMVTSPGGTTIEAVRHLEQAGVRAAFLNAMDAARRRSEELARGGASTSEV